MSVVISMSARYGTIIPIGSALCFKHLKQETQLKHSVEPIDEPSTSQLKHSAEPIDEPSTSTCDPDYEAEEVIISDQILDFSIQSGEDVTRILDASPIKF